MADPKKPTGQGIDPGLAAALQAATGSSQTATLSPTDINSIIQTALLGTTGRAGATNRPYVGFVPAWVRSSPDAMKLFQTSQIDPYLPTSDPNSWQVWAGTPSGAGVKQQANQSVRDQFNLPVKGDNPGDETRTASSVKNDPYLWSQDKVNEAIKKFRSSGFNSVQDFDSMKTAWGQLVDRAAATYSLSSGQQKVTPWEMLDLYKDEAKSAGLLAGLNADGSRTTHNTQRTVSDVDQGEAWDALRTTVSNMLGRDPNDQEVRDFAYRMNTLAAKSPTISHSTTTTSMSGDSSTSSHVTPGFTSADLQRGAYDDAQSDPDYAEHQAATTYYNALVSSLGSIGGN